MTLMEIIYGVFITRRQIDSGWLSAQIRRIMNSLDWNTMEDNDTGADPTNITLNGTQLNYMMETI